MWMIYIICDHHFTKLSFVILCLCIKSVFSLPKNKLFNKKSQKAEQKSGTHDYFYTTFGYSYHF